MLKLCNPNGWKCDMQSKYMTLKFRPNYLSVQNITNFHFGATTFFLCAQRLALPYVKHSHVGHQ